MVLLPIWQGVENTIELFDEAFNSAADSFVLNIKHKINCSRFSIKIKEVKACNGFIKFVFDLDSNVPKGIYSGILLNETTGLEVVEVKVEVY